MTQPISQAGAPPHPLTHVSIAAHQIERFEQVLSPERQEEVMAVVSRGREALAGRVVWNVNSTAVGGGVAEMLAPLLAYARGVGVDARWTVIEGDPDFFRVTKRLHNHLHGNPGDGEALDEEARQSYEATTERNAAAFRELLRPEDIVILHDPQTAGLVPEVREVGARVIWRCHVGLDRPNELARGAWNFLRPWVEQADAYVFSRRAFAWEHLDDSRIHLIAPTIDAFSAKNQELDDDTVTAILMAAGIMDGDEPALPVFTRDDGSPQRIDHAADATEVRPLGPTDRYVLQVSRWDRLKDPLGVIRGFVEHVLPHTDAHLVYAGPSVAAVADDPEGAEVLEEGLAAWDALPPEAQERVHLLALPMDDTQENAAIVNALQRRAAVVVQKSLAEGFGLTVAEAMWKGRPVVASRIGGIQDQVVDGETGLLVDDPADLAAYGRACVELLADPERAERMGAAARERVRDAYLGVRSLTQYVELFASLEE
jgi:trehalose synthase